YAVHGLSEALGIRKSWVPWVTLVMGLTGASLGLTFMIWTSAYDWPILLGGTMTLAALLLACGLPNYSKPILDRDLTNDRFGLWIPEVGPEWNEGRIFMVLKPTGAVDIRVLRV